MEKEALAIADTINAKCNANGICPKNIEGWTKVHKKLYKKEKFRFNPDFSGNHHSDFRLYVHFAPDWDFFIYGGVGKQLSSEKLGYIEF